MFAAALPIAPLLFLLTNWIDVKLDVSRLLTNGRRPLAVRAEDNGEWQRIMGLLNTLAVLNNAWVWKPDNRKVCNICASSGCGASAEFPFRHCSPKSHRLHGPQILTVPTPSLLSCEFEYLAITPECATERHEHVASSIVMLDLGTVARS
jgi:hypothetical protein